MFGHIHDSEICMPGGGIFMLWSKHRASRSHKQHGSRRTQLRLEQQLEGMVTLVVEVSSPSKVLALLSGNGVVLYHVATSGNQLYITIELDAFKKTQRILRDNHIRFRVRGKRGMPFFISRCKRRKGVWAGLICAVLMGHFLLSFLWTYEVTGNKAYSDAHIIALVQQYGLWPGTKLAEVDYEALEHTIELNHPEFTWVQLEYKGTTLCIDVKERLADRADIQDSGSIVAKADGRITALTVYTGTGLVDVGDPVQAGQVLIGGWDYPERIRNDLGVFVDAGEPYAVHAQGDVRGEVQHRAIGTCALEEKWMVKTGRTAHGTALLWGKHQLLSFGAKTSPYQYSETAIERKSIFHWGKWQCPLVLSNTTYEEQTMVEHSFTADEAYRTAVERARRILQQTMPQGGVFVRESSGMHRNTQDGMVQAEVVWVIEESLGQMAQIPLP